VYKVKSNNKFFALRFFSRKNTGAMKKYKLLHEFYEKNKGDKLSFLIDFEYLVNAIYVQVEKEKKRFPLLKMDWVEGKTLEKFLEELPDKNKIKMVKKYFKKMIDSMEELKIAHGDLHPKNIIVEDTEKLKLVDYDCFYIDEFNNFPMPEIGDKDCQHPNRLNFQFNHEIDRFSALVLYLAISVIEEKPEMVNARKGEFIFSSADYLDPDNSDVFNKILSLSDENRELVKFVIQYCKEKNPNIESLDSLLKKTTQKKTK
jgi:serine/threonine protein kinase